MKLMLIPPGEFVMGTNPGEIEELVLNSAEYNKTNLRGEGPERWVTIAQPFLLGKHEVTVGQFRAFVEDAKYRTVAETSGKGGLVYDLKARKLLARPENLWSNPRLATEEMLPVILVGLEDVRAFCNWLGKKEGKTYSVPSDDHWEFACRAGTTTRWFWGDSEADAGRYCWFLGNSAARSNPVGKLEANPFGLFDVAGNVAEMTLDPSGKLSYRGGTAGYPPVFARSAARESSVDPWPTYRVGFRVAVFLDGGRPVPSKSP
jgi:formylglycine-generating enzyme required for sulfatase activity